MAKQTKTHFEIRRLGWKSGRGRTRCLRFRVDRPGPAITPSLIIRPPTHHSHSHSPISPSHSDLNGNPSALTTLASRNVHIGMSTRAGDRNGADPAELGTHHGDSPSPRCAPPPAILITSSSSRRAAPESAQNQTRHPPPSRRVIIFFSLAGPLGSATRIGTQKPGRVARRPAAAPQKPTQPK
jgi:hypothetical protein